MRGNPLPVAWDGRAIRWREWREVGPVFMCDRSKRKYGLKIGPECSSCGTVGRAFSAVGVVDPMPGDVEQGEYLRTHRNGEPVFAQEPAPARAELTLHRCPSCGHDQVFDSRTGEAWDLGPEDYGPAGSTDPGA